MTMSVSSQTHPGRQNDRQIRVFVSSTFRDMHAEREELVKRVFPELRRLCEARGVTWGEVDLAEGMHVYGRPLPEGYIPIELSVDGGEALELVDVAYPRAGEISFEVIGESLPAYEGSLVIKATCSGTGREEENARVHVGLRYQACDSRECYVPQTVDFDLPVRVLPHDWERIELE